jgi:hypothetical protein
LPQLHRHIWEQFTCRATALPRNGSPISTPEGNPALDEGKGNSSEVADTWFFLASDISRHVSGVEIFVGGDTPLLL